MSTTAVLVVVCLVPAAIVVVVILRMLFGGETVGSVTCRMDSGGLPVGTMRLAVQRAGGEVKLRVSALASVSAIMIAPADAERLAQLVESGLERAAR